MQAFEGAATGLIFAPFTFFVTAGVLGVIDALLLLFF